jgi:NTE family protein
MLSHILGNDSYALCLSPGFFRFYAHLGILHALEESDLLNVSHVTGSSAGALVGAFLAAGIDYF